MTNINISAPELIGALAWATVKATAILGATALLARLLRTRSAALRHLLWTAALAASAGAVVLPSIVPAWRILPAAARTATALPPALTPALTPAPVALAPAAITGAIDAPPSRMNVAPAEQPGSAARTRATTRTRPWSLPGWPFIVVTAWMLGMAMVAARYVRSAMTLARLARSSAVNDNASSAAARLSQRMRIVPPPSVVCSDQIDVPLTWGVWRSHIALPADATDWPAQRHDHVLRHELAHVKRRDAATQLVAEAATALFWFHPLVWYAANEMRLERERACDDSVVTGGAIASDYADDLLAFVTNSGDADRYPVALAFARRSRFESRLLALLDPATDRRTVSARRVALTTIGVAMLALPLAAMQRAIPTASPAIASPAIAPRREPTVAAVVPPRPFPPRRPIAPKPPAELQDVFASCPLRMEHHDHDNSTDNNHTVWTASGETNGCRFDLSAEGGFAFNADATAIARLTPNSFLDITTTIHGDVTRLVERASATGDVTYEFTRNGRAAAFDVAGKAWLSQFLLGLDRVTAFAIDNRFPLLLRVGGAAGVLDEIGQMHTDYAQYEYVNRLIGTAPLDADGVRRAGAFIAQMSVAHEAADAIVALMTRYPAADSATRAGFLGAALGMPGDYEQSRVLLAALGGSGARLSDGQMLSVLSLVSRMNTDHSKMNVLLSLAQSQRIGGSVKDAFIAAARTIRIPSEVSRALRAIGERGG